MNRNRNGKNGNKSKNSTKQKCKKKRKKGTQEEAGKAWEVEQQDGQKEGQEEAEKAEQEESKEYVKESLSKRKFKPTKSRNVRGISSGTKLFLTPSFPRKHTPTNAYKVLPIMTVTTVSLAFHHPLSVSCHMCRSNWTLAWNIFIAIGTIFIAY